MYLHSVVGVVFVLVVVLSQSFPEGVSGVERHDVATLEEFKLARRSLRGLLVVPGVGRADRLLTLTQSLRLLYPHLKGKKAQWQCVVYVYAPRSDAKFWDNSDVKSHLEYIQTICDMVENPNKRITEHLRLVQPALIRRSYTHVFILFDDCKLVPASKNGLVWDLEKLLDVMIYNRLNVVSPRVENANGGGGQDFRKIMQADPVEGIEGYASIFIEMFAWVLKMEAYECLWELLLPDVNPYGWGYDFWFNNYVTFRTGNSHHKMGIVTTVTTLHEQSREIADDGKELSVTGVSGRADRADIKNKWNAVLAEEKYLKQYHGYDMAKFKINLSNSSWNGAVKGYLHTVPKEFVDAASNDRLDGTHFKGGRNRNGFGRKGGKRGAGEMRKRFETVS